METASIDALGSSTEQSPGLDAGTARPQDMAAFDEAVGRFKAAMGEGLGGLDLGGLGFGEGIDAPVAVVGESAVVVAEAPGGKVADAGMPDAKAADARPVDIDAPDVETPDDASAAVDPSVVVNPMAYNPIADAPVVRQVVADVMKVAAVGSAESVRSAFLAAAVEEVCEAIQVAPGVQPGQGEVRIQLKADVLSGTEVFLEAKGTTITVAFNPATADVAEILSRNIAQFQQHLAGRIHNYQIAARVKELKS